MDPLGDRGGLLYNLINTSDLADAVKARNTALLSSWAAPAENQITRLRGHLIANANGGAIKQYRPLKTLHGVAMKWSSNLSFAEEELHLGKAV